MSIIEQHKGIQQILVTSDFGIPKSLNVVMVTDALGLKEAYPVGGQGNNNINFTTSTDLALAPISNFDDKTSSDSELNPSAILSGALVAGLNSHDTSHNKLVNRRYNGNYLVMEAVVKSPLTTITNATTFILASDVHGLNYGGVHFGSDGIQFFTYWGGAYNTVKFVATPISINNTLRVVRLRDGVQFFVNNVLVGEHTHWTFDSAYFSDDAQYPGIGTFSRAGSVRSTGISNFKVYGSTSVPQNQLLAREALRRAAVPQNTWGEVCRFQLGPMSGSARVRMVNAGWLNPTQFSDRKIDLLLNGSSIGWVTAQNGGSLDLANIQIPPNSVMTVQASSTAGNQRDRIIDRGYVLVEGY